MTSPSEVHKTETNSLHLEPMHPLSLAHTENLADLLERMAGTAFTGRSLGEALHVAEAMLNDDCLVVMTLSGAMTMAGMNPLIIEMIERKWIHCLIATGALVGHGLIEDLGFTHYKAKREISDEVYYQHRLNRVYDVIEPEENLNRLESQIRSLLSALADEVNEPVGTFELLAHLGKHLPGKGVLQAAINANVPVIIPAFTDSELGLDFAVHEIFRTRQNKRPLRYDGFRDLKHYVALCERSLSEGKKLAIFTIGGGVPRNWAQQVGPFVDIRNSRLGDDAAPAVRFSYGIRICPDPVHYGHLSGCTYSEGVSWGKFVPPSEGGKFAEVLVDATVGWPLLVRALIERGH